MVLGCSTTQGVTSVRSKVLLPSVDVVLFETVEKPDKFPDGPVSFGELMQADVKLAGQYLICKAQVEGWQAWYKQAREEVDQYNFKLLEDPKL